MSASLTMRLASSSRLIPGQSSSRGGAGHSSRWRRASSRIGACASGWLATKASVAHAQSNAFDAARSSAKQNTPSKTTAGAKERNRHGHRVAQAAASVRDVAARERDPHELHVHIAGDVRAAGLVGELEGALRTAFGSREVAALDQAHRQVGEDERACRDDAVRLADRKPRAKVRRRRRVVAALAVEDADVGEGHRLAAHVAHPAGLRERVEKEPQRLVGVAHQLRDERHVVHHRRHAAQVGGGRGSAQPFFEVAFRVLVAGEAHAAQSQHLQREPTKLRVARLLRRLQRSRARLHAVRIGIAAEVHLPELSQQERLQRRRLRDERRRQCFLEQRDAVGETAAMLEERRDRRRRVGEEVGRFRGDRKAPRRAAVVELGLDRCQRRAVAVLRLARGLRKEPHEVRCVRSLRAVAFGQASRRELRDQRMQVKARPRLAQQRLVGERAQHGQRRRGHGARGFRRKPAMEDREPRERVALGLGQEAPRLVEHDLHARVPGGTRRIDRAQ